MTRKELIVRHLAEKVCELDICRVGYGGLLYFRHDGERKR